VEVVTPEALENVLAQMESEIAKRERDQAA
jgi:hypothetical protein